MTNEQKIAKLKENYDNDEILEILGVYDGSNSDYADVLDEIDVNTVDMTRFYNDAINNGNFEHLFLPVE